MNARSVKSFSISSARRSSARVAWWVLTVWGTVIVWGTVWVILALAVLAAEPAAAKKKKKPTDAADLFNPLLGLDYSHWLVGPVVDVATLDEVDAYLALAGDEEAAEFIESFWAKRAEGIGFFEKKPQQIYEERVTEANKRFSEGEIPGRQTDRGKVWTLYGEPEEVEFEKPREVRTPTLEVWRYPKDAVAGLDGEQPKQVYRFVAVDGSTVFYINQKRRPDRFRPDSRRRRDGSGGL